MRLRKALTAVTVTVTVTVTVLVFLGGVGLAHATEYFTGPGGNDNNDCNAATNRPTRREHLGKGVECLQPGDTLTILNGTYHEYLVNVIPSGLDASHPTVVRAENKRQVILDTLYPGSTTMIVLGEQFDNYPTCTIGQGRHYITLQGLVFAIPTSQSGFSIAMWGGNRDYRCYPAGWSEQTDGTTYINFLDNEIYGGMNTNSLSQFTTGIGQPGNGKFLTFRGNYLHDLGMVGLNPATDTAFSYGMYISGSDNLIENNEFTTYSGWAIHGYSTGDHFHRNVIRNNYFHDAYGPGILLCGSGRGAGTGNQVYNNIFYRMAFGQNHGSYVGSIMAGSSCSGVNASDNQIYNNTIVKSRGQAPGGGVQGCITLADTGVAQNNTVRNNICWAGTPNDDIRLGTGASANVIDHNICSAGGCLSHSDPLFTNTNFTAPEHFQLGAGSPAINVGVDTTGSGQPVTITQDYGGNSRNAGGAQDFGAWESGGAPLPPPNPNPIAWWTFEEGSGTTAADSTGNGHTLTFSTGSQPTWGPGRVGTHSLKCQGNTGYAATPAFPATSWTAMLWFQAAAPLSLTQPELISINGTDSLSWGFGWGHSVPEARQSAFYRDFSGAYGNIKLLGTLTPGVWYHLARTWDSATKVHTVYVNGAVNNTVTYAANVMTPAGNFAVCGDGKGGQPWAGLIDEGKIWARVLTATEIQTEYTSAPPLQQVQGVHHRALQQ